MQGIVWGGLVPHPPLIIPDIGRNERKKVSNTVDSMENISRELAEVSPDFCVLISPHGPAFHEGLPIWNLPYLEGDFGQFGYPHVRLKMDIDQKATDEIIRFANEENKSFVALDDEAIKRFRIQKNLDHGALVPLYFLKEEGLEIPFVNISMGLLSYQELYEAGKLIGEAVRKSQKRAAVLASGDLSHCLIQGAPAGYHSSGAVFDEKLKNFLEAGDFKKIMDMDPSLIEEAAECGYRPIMILLGALNGLHIKPKVHSYEGPFGVGYLVASFQVKSDKGNDVDQADENKKTAAFDNNSEKDEAGFSFIQLAKESLEKFVRHGRPLHPPTGLPEKMKEKAGVFVTLKKEGRLRGCIGTVSPVQDNVAEEIIANAISAGTEDPRFNPVTPSELPHLKYSVDVLKASEPIEDIDSLDPHRYGIIVRKGIRSGLLLPNLEGIDTPKEQVRIACQKAGIDFQEESFDLERFEVLRYE